MFQQIHSCRMGWGNLYKKTYTMVQYIINNTSKDMYKQVQFLLKTFLL
jgi:hypothetical protein